MAGEPSILVVDDSESIRRTMAMVLGHKGCEIDTVASGPEALERVGQRPYDLIFMDIRMPVMDGVETYKRVKALRPDAAVMMMTGYAVEELVQDAVRHGARGVLYKPLDFDKVFQIIEQAHAGRRGGLILVVDDDPGTAATFQSILEQKGYGVGVAHSGEEAVELATARRWDLLFIDMKLPALNGLETYLAIRKADPEAVCIMMTGYRQEMAGLVQGALDAQAYACLYKPLDMDRVLGLVERVLEEKRAAPPMA